MQKPLTRRSVLALTLAGTAAAPPALSAAAAGTLLDAPNDAPLPDLGPTLSTDPAAFAEAVNGDMSGAFDWGESFGAIAPEDEAAYVQARAALVRAYPAFATAGVGHPFTRLDEAAFSWRVGAYLDGLRAGAAYEHFRLALVGTQQVCLTCHGLGTIVPGAPYRMVGGPTTCPTCGGHGVTPVTR